MEPCFFRPSLIGVSISCSTFCENGLRRHCFLVVVVFSLVPTVGSVLTNGINVAIWVLQNDPFDIP